MSEFRIGQEVRLRFGGSGATQVARIERIRPDMILVRRFRVRSQKWNKGLEAWVPAVFAEEVSEVAAMIASPGRRAQLESFLPENQEITI